MNRFETEDFEVLFLFLKSLLLEGYQVRITPGSEKVFTVDFILPEYGEGSFELVKENKEC